MAMGVTASGYTECITRCLCVFLSIKVTGGMLSKGLTPNQLGAAVSLFIFSSEDIRPCALIQNSPVTNRKFFFFFHGPSKLIVSLVAFSMAGRLRQTA